MDIEELQTTKTEKFLAGVLAVFLLIAGIWAYQKIDDYVADVIQINMAVNASVNDADRAAIARLQRALNHSYVAQRRFRSALRNLEFQREEYRTALDAGRAAPQLERAYHRAQDRLAAARHAQSAAALEVKRAQPEAEAARQRAFAEAERRQDRRELYSFLFRLALVVASIVATLWLVLVVHRRRSRYVPLSLGAVAAATVLAFVLAGDYVTDYVDPLDLGVLFLGLFGALVTVLAFAALQ
jgi:uncharacterized membrane protein YqiK